jgi:hypothetical protein
VASKELTLWVTHCSWKKKPVQEGSPEELYGSPRISNFIAYCKRNTLAWAILSAKHSLFFPDEKKPNYNATFKSDPSTKQCRVLENNRLLDETASRAWLNQLVLDVRQKILSRNVRSIMFWPGEPRDGVDPLMRVKCYLKFLHAGADECAVDHGSWREIVQHIDALSRSGDGRIEFVERLPQ